MTSHTRPQPPALETALDALPDWLIVLDATGAVTHLNREAAMIGGLDAATAPGQTLAHLFDSSGRRASTSNADRLAGKQRISIFHQHIQRNFDVYRPWTSPAAAADSSGGGRG